MNVRLLLSLLVPFIACAVQWLLWDYIKPYVWFLFFPAAFFSAWLGGLVGGLAGTALGGMLVWFVFMPPVWSFRLDNPASAFSIVLFVIMGGLFSWLFERLRQAMQRTDEALEVARTANDKITELYRRTLELDELKNQFFANVSHELRTPLTLIMSPLAQRLAQNDLPPEWRHEDERMLRNARLLYRQVSDLLDAAKLEAGRMGIDYTRFDLGALTRAMASQFDSLAQERHFNFRALVPAPFMAEADAEKVQRILLNLLSNAFKFTPDGGEIEVRLRREGEEAVLEVEDNGPGVPEAQREAVFERFRQVEGQTSRHDGGTGLGLAIVREFAQLHQGSALLQAASGGGALFVVRLPLQAPAAAQVREEAVAPLDMQIEQAAIAARARASSPAEIQNSSSHAPLVLVVEDNPDMNAFLLENLRAHYRVATAFDGREGLEKAQKRLPDLILADVMMPNMSGDEMALALRRHADTRDIPIVMLTARADDALRVRLLKADIQDYLNKPFSVEELLARVGGLIASRRRSTARLRESEARLRLFIDHAPAALAMFDREMRYLVVSHRWLEDYGLLGRDILGCSHYDVFPEISDALRATHQRGLAGETLRSDADRFVRENGRVQWLRWEMLPWLDAEGRVGGIVIFSEDITSYIGAKAEIQRLNSDLEARVQARTQELSAANRELDSFAYAVSHDLRAPLRAMNGFAQALREDYGATLQGDARVFLEQIMLASTRMDELINGLLALSRSTRGELQRTPIDLSAMAERLLSDLARGNAGRMPTWQVEPGLSATGDARMMEAVLLNLLDNAWKYTGQCDAAQIRVYAGEVEGEPGFCVADNGAGFDMAHANRLFQPFQRLHRQDEFPGIGIGLATVQRIIHRHGGVITAHGAPGQGAVFCFSLPPFLRGGTGTTTGTTTDTTRQGASI